jgi:hypothetical protein
MEKVTGIGGLFFRAQDPAALGRWYQEHLWSVSDAVELRGIAMAAGGRADRVQPVPPRRTASPRR